MSKVILAFRDPINLINNLTTNQPGLGALDASIGKSLQDSIDNKNSLKVMNGNEVNIANGFTKVGSSPYMFFNYSGCIDAIESIRFCNGKGPTIVDIFAKDFICSSIMGKRGALNSRLSEMTQTITFTGSSVDGPVGSIKNQWNSATLLLSDGTYMIKIKCGANYGGMMLITNTSMNPTDPANYAFVFIIGYGAATPITLRMSNSTWV